MSDSENKIQMDPRFVRLQSFVARLGAFEQEASLTYLRSPKVVVAGEVFVALGLAKQASELINTASESLGFSGAALQQEIPEDQESLGEIMQQLAAAAQQMAEAAMAQFGINAEAAKTYSATFTDELIEIIDDMLTRAEKHYVAARVADVASVPQADGDDGQTPAAE